METQILFPRLPITFQQVRKKHQKLKTYLCPSIQTQTRPFIIRITQV